MKRAHVLLDLYEIVGNLRKTNWCHINKIIVDFEDDVIKLTPRETQTVSVIAHLTETQIQGISLKTLCEYLKLNKATVSVITNKLVEKNLLISMENPSNRRAKLLRLSALGRRHAENAFRNINKTFTELTKDIDERDFQTFMEVAHKITLALKTE